MEPKNIAKLAYLSTLLLYIHFLLFVAVLGVAVIINNDKKDSFASFHIRQMMGIGAIALVLNVFAGAIPDNFYWLAFVIITLVVLMALLGFASVMRNQKIELPYIGSAFQKWFSFIK